MASKVDIENLIICNGNDVYPLRSGKTKLEPKNYKYLRHFLDVTKSNLLFAKGVIIVEGWAEEILIPAIAERLGYNLSKYEVSIINVGSTAYLHFAKIFLRNDGKSLDIPVAVITDLDIRPNDSGEFNEVTEEEKRESINSDFDAFNRTKVKLNIAKQWTLEWCLYKSSSLAELFKEAVAEVHSHTSDFKKGEAGQFKLEFQKKLIHKLTKKEGTSALDKVAVATELAVKISETKALINDNDEYIKYLIDSIKHACRING